MAYLLTHDFARGRRRGGRRRRGGGGRGWCRGHDDNSKSGLVGSARVLPALPCTRSTLCSSINDLIIPAKLVEFQPMSIDGLSLAARGRPQPRPVISRLQLRMPDTTH